MISRYDRCYGFLQRCMRQIAERGLVLDLGTFYAFRKELKAFEPLFQKTRYVCMGYKVTAGGQDQIPDLDGDICNLPFKDEVAEAIICKDVLEHVLSPERAASEMYRVLKKEGVVYSSVPFVYPYHGSSSENNLDLWRFTRDGIKNLFREFRKVEIVAAGGIFLIFRAFMPLWLNRLFSLPPLVHLLNALDALIPTKNTAPLYLVLARK